MSDSAAAMPTASTAAPQDAAARSSTSRSNKPDITSATAAAAAPGSEQQISYSAERIIGNGSFGVVFQAAVVETGEIVAIKKVLQDKRFKNRELQIMRQLVKDPHSNIVALKHCFYSQGEKPDELYLNLVLEYVPETVYSISRFHQKSKIALPLIMLNCTCISCHELWLTFTRSASVTVTLNLKICWSIQQISNSNCVISDQPRHW